MHTVQAQAPPVRSWPGTPQASVAVLPSLSLLTVKRIRQVRVITQAPPANTEAVSSLMVGYAATSPHTLSHPAGRYTNAGLDGL